jgi:WD40 repeat protein
MLVITGAKDCSIIIGDAEDGTCISALNGHLGFVRCLLPFYLELGSGPALQIASGSMDSTVKVSDYSASAAVN